MGHTGGDRAGRDIGPAACRSLSACLVVLHGLSEAAKVTGEVQGDRGGVGAVDGHGQGLVPPIVQGIHGVAEEFFGQALSAVIGVGEKVCDESGCGAVASEGFLCCDDGCGDAAFWVGS